MRELVPGHSYALQNLKGEGETVLQFYQDPELHGGEGADGPSTQEVIRAAIKRVQELDREKPWEGNHTIIVAGLRQAILGFELRALERKVEKGLAIEDLPVGPDGHIIIQGAEDGE